MLRVFLLITLFVFVSCESKPEKDHNQKVKTMSPQPAPPASFSKIQFKDVNYRSEGKDFKGYISQPQSTGKRPAILLIPEYWGVTTDMKDKARGFSSRGYVVLVVDLYGKQKHTSNPDTAQKWLNSLDQSGMVLKNTLAAFEKLKSFPSVDTSRISLVGYTYGGALAVEIARRGYAFSGIVNVHGAVGSQHPAKPGFVKAPILWLKGEHDAYIPEKMEEGFQKEMKTANAQLKVVTYPDGFNGFSNPQASKIGKKNLLPIKYDGKINQEAQVEILTFLAKAGG